MLPMISATYATKDTELGIMQEMVTVSPLVVELLLFSSYGLVKLLFFNFFGRAWEMLSTA